MSLSHMWLKNLVKLKALPSLSILLLLLIGSLSTTAQNDVSCVCDEYIYLNEVANGGQVHKFKINADGTVSEINAAGPWYPNGGTSVLEKPHGLGTDLNGYLYVASHYDPVGEIHRLDCDGNIQTDFTPIPNTGTFNIASVGNLLYANTSGSNDVTSYSSCDGSSVSSVCFAGLPANIIPSDDWGFYYDKRTEYFYSAFPQDSTDDAKFDKTIIYRYTAADFGSGTCVQPFVESANTIYRNLPTVGDNAIPFTNISGITTDDQGNIYYTATGYLEDGQVIKLDANGNFLAASAIDATDGDGGFWGARAIVWSETSGKLYVSTQTTSVTEDCIAIFDTDLNYEGAAVFAGGTTGLSGSGKAMAIAVECCPIIESPMDVNEEYCEATVGETISLIDFLPCEFICAGAWTVIGTPTAGVFNSCDNSFTIDDLSGEVCMNYKYEPNGNANAVCEPFEINLCITFIDCTTPCATPNCAGVTVIQN